jgi:hypothetical protein
MTLWQARADIPSLSSSSRAQEVVGTSSISVQDIRYSNVRPNIYISMYLYNTERVDCECPSFHLVDVHPNDWFGFED